MRSASVGRRVRRPLAFEGVALTGLAGFFAFEAFFERGGYLDRWTDLGCLVRCLHETAQ